MKVDCFGRDTTIYRNILPGHVLQNQGIDFGGKVGKIPLVTRGDTAFPKNSRQVKVYSKKQNTLFSNISIKKLFSASVVTENAFEMLKGGPKK